MCFDQTLAEQLNRDKGLFLPIVKLFYEHDKIRQFRLFLWETTDDALLWNRYYIVIKIRINPSFITIIINLTA